MAKRRLNVEYGKYKLLHNTAYIDYEGYQSVEVGKIIDTQTNQDVMYVYYNKNNFQENGYHTNIDIYKDQNGEYPVANVDDMHRACLYDYPDIFLAMMLHEYGHYVNGDFTRTDATNKQIQGERLHCIRIGRVSDEERKADAFAVRYVGKATFLQCLDYMIEKRKQRGNSANDLAIREFELRKRAVRNM